MLRKEASLRSASFLIAFLLLVAAPSASGRAAAFNDQPAPKDQAVARHTLPQSAAKMKYQEARLRVVDEQGRDIEKFDVVARMAEGYRSGWKHGVHGRTALDFLQRFSATNSIDLFVRAPDLVTAIEHFGGSTKDRLLSGETTMVLERGEAVLVRFRLPPGMTWPANAKPDVYFEHDRGMVLAGILSKPDLRRRSLEQMTLNAQTVKPGECQIRLSRKSPPFYAGVSVPGFLQGFECGPFTLPDVKNGVLDIDVPKPAVLTVHLEAGNRKLDQLPFRTWNVQLTRRHGRQARSGATQIAIEMGIPSTRDFKAVVPPGDYAVSMSTVPTGDESRALPPFVIDPDDPSTYTGKAGAFHDRKRDIALAAGQSQTVDIHYVPFDANAYRGDRTAIVEVLLPDGKPAAGREIRVEYVFPHYFAIPLFAGKVPADGKIVLTNITPGANQGPQSTGYSVLMGWALLGTFQFKTKDQVETFKTFLPPIVGDMAPECEIISVASGKRARLSDFRGRVVCLDFWATWCGSCQRPMKDLDAFLAEKGERLKDRVSVVPISIDDQAGLVTPHLKKQGWTHLDHYWAGNEEPDGFKGAAARKFVITDVPTTILIDRGGRIVWRGDPTEKVDGKDLETRIVEAAAR
jgi:thiol-disulfide isomerase/thioredoxin